MIEETGLKINIGHLILILLGQAQPCSLARDSGEAVFRGLTCRIVAITTILLACSSWGPNVPIATTGARVTCGVVFQWEIA
jgi:hypothetical protein